MKKLVLLLSICAFAAACSSDSSTTSTDKDKYYETSDVDSTNSAEMSATTRQSEVDTTRMNVGTDRTEGGAALANAEKGAKLIALSDCTACHKIDQKLVGPAYEAVAAKYQKTDKDLDYLAGKIIDGGKGVWGEIPMTPHPNLSKEEARQMAEYILSLKK